MANPMSDPAFVLYFGRWILYTLLALLFTSEWRRLKDADVYFKCMTFYWWFSSFSSIEEIVARFYRNVDPEKADQILHSLLWEWREVTTVIVLTTILCISFKRIQERRAYDQLPT